MSADLTAIRFIAFDVDGVFTDGRFYLSDDGKETKAFHTQDGYGVRQLLDRGIGVGVISGRNSEATARRMQDLGVQHVALGCKDKVTAFNEMLEQADCELSNSAFVGDDVPDLPLLAHAGMSIAVANAVEAVKAVADYVTNANGGFGAVREISDRICAADKP